MPNKKNIIKIQLTNLLTKLQEHWLKLLISILIFFIVFLIIISFGVYWGGWHNKASYNLVKIIPYPAAVINGEVITIKEFLDKKISLTNQINNQPTVDSQKILSSIIQDKILNQIATEFNLTVSEEEIAEYMKQVVNNLGSPVVITEIIKKEYGWSSLNTYIEQIIKPLLINQKLEQYWETISPNKESYQKIQELYSKIKLNPGNFETLAAQYNQDQTAAVAGELGWVTYGDLLPELQKIVITLKPNEFSQPIITEHGYYILKVGQKTTDDNGREVWQAYQIFFKRSAFSQYLAEQIKKAKVISLLKLSL